MEGPHSSEDDSLALRLAQTETDATVVVDVVRLGMRVTRVTTIRSRSGTEGLRS